MTKSSNILLITVKITVIATSSTIAASAAKATAIVILMPTVTKDDKVSIYDHRL